MPNIISQPEDADLHLSGRYFETNFFLFASLNLNKDGMLYQVGAHPAAREAPRARIDARGDGAHPLRHSRPISSGSPQMETNIPKILPRE